MAEIIVRANDLFAKSVSRTRLAFPRSMGSVRRTSMIPIRLLYSHGSGPTPKASWYCEADQDFEILLTEAKERIQGLARFCPGSRNYAPPPADVPSSRAGSASSSADDAVSFLEMADETG